MQTKHIRYADLMTTIRIITTFSFSLIISFKPTLFGFYIGEIIILLIYLTDGLDGFFARNIDKPSKFGAFYDITGDRIAEIVLLIPFVYLGILTPILPMYFITKGFLINYLRTKKFITTHKAPFEQSQNKLFVLLVKNRIMRNFYGITKLTLTLFLYASFFYNIKNSHISLLTTTVIITSLLRTFPAFIDK